ncbi:ABC transporter permease subunit [Thermofilum sp.]|uniref:ABC transporter permease n=1 Tax=Thermofilum sp. TaxID=1961369 RepID=UPI0031600B22
MPSVLTTSLKYIYLVIIVFFAILAPFIFIFYRSITYRTYEGTYFVGLKFYNEITPAYWRALLNSIAVGLLVSVFDFLIAFPAAYVLSRYEFKFKKLVAALIVAPMFTPDVVAGVGLSSVYIKYYGLFGTYLGTVLGLASTSYPMMLLPLFASLKTLDPVYEDVAKSLGATPLQATLRVTLPLIGPGIFSGFVLTFVWCINNYLLPLFLTGGAIDLLAVKLYSDIRWWGLLGRVAAEASVLQLTTFIVVLLYLKTIGARYRGGFAI